MTAATQSGYKHGAKKGRKAQGTDPMGSDSLKPQQIATRRGKLPADQVVTENCEI